MKRLRFRGFSLVLWLLLSFIAPGSYGETSYGETSKGEHTHHTEHSRVGFHGMVLVTDGTELYASHLPLYVNPHDYQLVYLVESAYKTQLLDRLSESEKGGTGKVGSGTRTTPLYQQNMVTLLPAKFDLNQLINGGSFEIATQFFTGHFERGGDKWIKDDNLKFVRQVYKRPLANQASLAKTESSNQASVAKAVSWNVLNTAQTETQLFIFPIQTSPSFDAIVLGTSCSDKRASLPTSLKRVPDFAQLKKAFAACKANQLLYFETRDFAQ